MGAEDYLPDDPGSLAALRTAAEGCHGCDLYRAATQTVFGEGPPDARIVMIGEQPGDVEDRAGEPFVGPAGRLLDRAITEAGLQRSDIYVTNAVKHFKFVPPERGKRRIHKTPNRAEIVACRPWLVQELAVLRPSVLVVLGASAAKALLGAKFKVTESRGQLLPWPDAADRPEDFPAEPSSLVATIHPSAVLRSDDREAMFRGLVADLRVAAEAL
ncbi:MAG: UdgX family uracil-DNA binding protein [Hamadaea sp.]|uniref:UdgX family uracil-DNA binding protein n=1 Tax=Hamadaea sp. TaxID=2024425 RepID=UPI00182E5DC4|nr:UdgX family uracil-DNA binding protein [Hamadaea sp.]NUR70199.1 UdgX family uracil-DNA binding protein [Hamadaea sp.]NUT24134.1 UdgX family uracil-DNA binding protein [Hamadaea sp.]